MTKKKPQSPTIEELKQTLAQVQNAMGLIASASFDGYQAEKVYAALSFLKSMEVQLKADLEKLIPSESQDFVVKEK